MSNTDMTLTTGEFSNVTGLTVSTIAKMLRLGKLSGEKRKGKWAIFESELQRHKIQGNKKGKQFSGKTASVANIPASHADSYTIEEFARLTYLTEKGVHNWLKTGRLTGNLNPGGSGMVDGDNLSRPELRHLIR